MGHEGFEKDLLGSTGVFKAQYRRLLLDEVRHTSHDGRRSSVEGVNVSLVGVWFVKNIVYIVLPNSWLLVPFRTENYLAYTVVPSSHEIVKYVE